MMKRFSAYILSLSVLIAFVYVKSDANELNYSRSHFALLDSSSHAVSYENLQNDFPFTELTNTHPGRKAGIHPTGIETEVDDEVREFGKAQFSNYLLSSNYSAQVIACFLSLIDHAEPAYSYRASFSECWYILFRVFRL